MSSPSTVGAGVEPTGGEAFDDWLGEASDPIAGSVEGWVTRDSIFYLLEKEGTMEWLTNRPIAHRGLHSNGVPENTIPAFEAAIDAALATYHLVAVASEGHAASKRSGDAAEWDHDADVDAPLVVVGPAAFPDILEGTEDLPHILDVPGRDVSDEAAAVAAEQRFRDDAAEAVRARDDERIQTLLDVSYELEAWGPVELSTARGRLDEATQSN